VITVINRFFRFVRTDMQHSIWVNAENAGKILYGYQQTLTPFDFS
jgi:hypothetical protein